MTKSIMPEDKSKCNFTNHEDLYISIYKDSSMQGKLQCKISFIGDNKIQASIRMKDYIDLKGYACFGYTMGTVWIILSPLTAEELTDLVEKSVAFIKMPYEERRFIERKKFK